MYNVSAVSLQNIYAPSASARSSSNMDDVDIFDYYLGKSVDNDDASKRIIDEMAAAGIFETEEDEEEDVDAVDELLKAIKERQEAWKEQMFGIKKKGLTVEEVKEVLSELNFVSCKTVI